MRVSGRLKRCALAGLVAALMIVNGCAGGSSNGTSNPPPPSTNNLVSIAVTPPNQTIAVGNSQQFKATGTFSDSSTKDLTSSAQWSSTSTTVASIVSGGTATAMAPGTTTIKATSGSISGSTSITVRSQTPGLVSISVTPATPTISVGSTQQLHATGVFTDGTNQDLTTTVKWSSSNSGVATVNSSGLVAGAAAGTATIKAAFNRAAGQSTVTVAQPGAAADLTVNFAASGLTIPPGIFGAHLSSMTDQNAVNPVAQAGFTQLRTNANVPAVYATQTPAWGNIDGAVKQAQRAGMKVMLIIMWTPPWLQPTPNNCPSPATAPPTDMNAWGQMAASYVAHMDANFPGVVTDYEIWNEPDTQRLCAADKEQSYLQMYAAAAPLMKQQAQKDGATIRVGGPATSGTNVPWVSALTTDPTTYPYVDFVSFHSYLGGPNEIKAGMTWTSNVTSHTGLTGLWGLTVDSAWGEAGRYKAVAATVRLGKQPNPATTPIYLDEYNDDWWFYPPDQPDCCRNTPAYSPVWNGLVVTELFNTVYGSGGAGAVPDRLTYFALDGTSFCLVGTVDGSWDCGPNPPTAFDPYPQYYLYDLVAGPNYLALAGGGQMAKSVSESQTITNGIQGVVATAFSTSKGDSILIVNPTSTSYSQLGIAINNPHNTTATTANVFTMNNPSAAAAPVSGTVTLNSTSTGFTASVSVPALSVVGITVPAH